MPASRRAAVLSAARPLPPLMMAPGVAHSGGRARGHAGDEAATRLFFMLALVKAAAPLQTFHPISPIEQHGPGLGILLKQRKDNR